MEQKPENKKNEKSNPQSKSEAKVSKANEKSAKKNTTQTKTIISKKSKKLKLRFKENVNNPLFIDDKNKNLTVSCLLILKKLQLFKSSFWVEPNKFLPSTFAEVLKFGDLIGVIVDSGSINFGFL